MRSIAHQVGLAAKPVRDGFEVRETELANLFPGKKILLQLLGKKKFLDDVKSYFFVKKIAGSGNFLTAGTSNCTKVLFRCQSFGPDDIHSK